MLNKIQIEYNINWLLENGSDSVKYLTYRNILKGDAKVSSDLFKKVENSELVKDIFSKQKEDGAWCSHGAWATKTVMRKSGYTPVSPKYVTTAWILPILGDLGFSIADERIKKACEYILTYQYDNGYIGEIKPKEQNTYKEGAENEPCRFSIILIALAKVGAINDSRVQKAFDLLINWQRADGGWVSENHSTQKKWIRSCPYSSYHASMALYSAGVNNFEKYLRKALGFLLTHLSLKKDFEIQRFFYHGHSIIHELLMFSELKIGLDTNVVKTMLNWLLSMFQPQQSFFKYNAKPISKYKLKDDYMDSRVAKYRLFQLIKDDWLTYYATRIFRNLLDCED